MNIGHKVKFQIDEYEDLVKKKINFKPQEKKLAHD